MINGLFNQSIHLISSGKCYTTNSIFCSVFFFFRPDLFVNLFGEIHREKNLLFQCKPVFEAIFFCVARPMKYWQATKLNSLVQFNKVRNPYTKRTHKHIQLTWLPKWSMYQSILNWIPKWKSAFISDKWTYIEFNAVHFFISMIPSIASKPIIEVFSIH